MKLYIKNKLISLSGASFVNDEAGDKVYKVRGKVFSLHKKKFVCDLDGKVLYMVKNKLFNLFLSSAFVCDAKGKKLCKVRVVPFKGFAVEGYKDEISIVGKPLALTKTISKNGVVVGTMHTDFNLFRDSFQLDVDDNEDIAFMIALVIAIDNICDNNSNQHD